MGPQTTTILLSLLGVPEFSAAGARPPRYKKARTLLFLLAAEPERTFPRDGLCELLWPEEGRETARTNLRRMLHHVRDSLELQGPVVHAQGDGLRIDAEFVRHVDLTLFAALAERSGPYSAHDLALAEALWRGEFLEAWDDSGTEFEAWMREQRHAWHARARSLFLRIGEQCAARGEFTPAVRAAERAVALDLADGAAMRNLLELLARCDRACEVGDLYRRHQQYLRDEFASAPERATAECYARIGTEFPACGAYAGRRAQTLLQAAQRALRRWDYEETQRLCDQASRTLPQEAPAVAALLKEELDALHAIIAERLAEHSHPPVRGLFGRALALVPEGLFLLRFAAWAGVEAKQGPVDAEKSARQLFTQAERCGEWARRRAEMALILTLFWQGKFIEAAARAQSVVLPNIHVPDIVERHGGGAIDVMILALQGWALLFRGDAEAAEFAMERALTTARLRGDASSLANALAYAANLARWREQPERCLALAEELVCLDHAGPAILISHGRLLRHWCLHRLGRPGDTASLAAAVERIRRETPAMEAMARFVLADAATVGARPPEARACIEAALAAGDRFGHTHYHAELHRCLAGWHRANGSEESATAQLARAEQVARAQGNLWVVPRIESTRARR